MITNAIKFPCSKWSNKFFLVHFAPFSKKKFYLIKLIKILKIIKQWTMPCLYDANAYYGMIKFNYSMGDMAYHMQYVLNFIIENTTYVHMCWM